jgi:murein DD-endopeptidase MepM/ murein hydrolase activator NlpD
MPGVVTFSGWQRDYGTMVIIRHAQGFESVYAHNHSNLVQKGQIVEKGQIIALMGRTGNATGCHVHFELRKNGRPVDPLAYFNR